MADYLIEGEILSAIADTVRGYVSGISPEGSPGDPMTLNIDVNVYYREFIDYSSTYDGLVEGGDNDTFVAFAYLQNNEGVTVPVLYDTDIGNYEQPDIVGPFFYEGTAEIDGVVYDKWRKIEIDGDSAFTWDSVAKQYIYTDVIVGLSPAELPLMIDNVYDEGYTVGYGDGYAEGEANGKPILYGTYTLAESPEYIERTSALILDVNDYDVYAHFLRYTGNYRYGKVYKFAFNISSFSILDTDPDEPATLGYANIGGWSAYNAGQLELPDNRFRAIDFKEPVEVTQEVYDLFMRMVDNTDVTPYEIGKQAQYDEIWDEIQGNGSRTGYLSAFVNWCNEYIRPKYKVVPTAARSLYGTFESCPNLKKLEADYFDFSQVPYGTAQNQSASYTFYSCINLEEIEDIGLPASYSYVYTFAICEKLRTIAKITVDKNTIFNSTFHKCYELVNLTIEGTIGQNGLNLQWSTKLSKDSFTSVFSALSETTSGLSVTFSLVAKNAAFPPPASGLGNVDWGRLVASRSNWTIKLV